VPGTTAAVRDVPGEDGVRHWETREK
jgi:hypothetical protein